jgi:hypothetical protein
MDPERCQTDGQSDSVGASESRSIYDRPNVRPFWSITKHADIIQISRQPKRSERGVA